MTGEEWHQAYGSGLVEGLRSGLDLYGHDRHGMMHDPEGDGTWVCLNPRCKATTEYDSEDPDQ